MLFIAIGLAAGVLAGMFGIGGGIVIGPALILLAKFQPQTATGTSLGALLLPVGLAPAQPQFRLEAPRFPARRRARFSTPSTGSTSRRELSTSRCRSARS